MKTYKEIIKELHADGESTLTIGNDIYSFIFDFDDCEVQKNGEYLTTLDHDYEIKDFLEFNILG